MDTFLQAKELEHDMQKVANLKPMVDYYTVQAFDEMMNRKRAELSVGLNKYAAAAGTAASTAAKATSPFISKLLPGALTAGSVALAAPIVYHGLRGFGNDVDDYTKHQTADYHYVPKHMLRNVALGGVAGASIPALINLARGQSLAASLNPVSMGTGAMMGSSLGGLYTYMHSDPLKNGPYKLH